MKKSFGLLFGLLFIFLFTARSLVLNMSSNLVDWRDYTYLTWVINQNIGHIKTLDFVSIFNTNAFYPNTNTIFLSDTLFTQSLIGLPFSFIVNNPIVVFNSIYIVTFFLNLLSAYLLWKRVFKNDFVAFIGSLMIVFSPIFSTQMGHFQIQNYWPLLFSLFLLLKNEDPPRNTILFLVGLFLTVQFLASVYLAFFLGTILFLLFLIRSLTRKSIRPIINFLSILLVFGLSSGVFIKGYFETQKQYHAQRDYGEYVTYSAHVSDYLFPQQKGWLYQNKLVSRWMSFNKHNIGELASFPGFVLSITAIFGLFGIKNLNKRLVFSFVKNESNYLFLGLILIGFLFSLGPRINFNGVYANIPLPYTLLIKYIPIFNVIRGTSRWSFLLYLGLTYFSLQYLKNANKKIIVVIIAILVLEIIPLTFQTQKGTYITTQDQVLNEICGKTKTVILEIPVTHFDTNGGIAEGLSYITKRLLASEYNHCYLVNGYSGYDLPQIQKIKDGLVYSVQEKKTDVFIGIIKQTGSSIIAINKDDLNPNLYSNLPAVLLTLEKEGRLYNLGNDLYQINDK